MHPPEPRPDARSGRPIQLLWIGLAILGWTGVIWLGSQLYSTDPPSAGFDLELLLDAGRSVALGGSPYDPDMISGVAPAAPSLFYSYPPPVAQAMTMASGVPSIVVFVAWALAAVGGLLVAAEALRRCLAPHLARATVMLPVLAVAPFVFPFTVGLLFGNADVFFPLLYGLMLAAALSESRRANVRAGVALAFTSLKLHPASLGLWFIGRGLRQRSAGEPAMAWLAVATAAVTIAAIFVVSLIVGGIGPWSDYVAVIRAGSGADIVDPRNAAPAAVMAGLAGGDAGMARLLQVPVTTLALVVTLAVAVRDDDVVESFAVATIASLVILPVTWYHYPAALLPVAIASILRARAARVRPTIALIVAAAVIATISVLWLPLLWIAVALVALAARSSRPNQASASAGVERRAEAFG